MTDTTGVARVSHRFSVPAERVYDAFLDVSKARRFLYASPAGEIVQAELDPRVGGAYVITDQRDGAEVEHSGTYLELERPRRIVLLGLKGDGLMGAGDRVGQSARDKLGAALFLPSLSLVRSDIAIRRVDAALLGCSAALFRWAQGDQG